MFLFHSNSIFFFGVHVVAHVHAYVMHCLHVLVLIAMWFRLSLKTFVKNVFCSLKLYALEKDTKNPMH